LTPALAFREEVYHLPNPFKTSYFGVGPVNNPQRVRSDWILISRDDFEGRKILSEVQQEYLLVFMNQHFELYRLKTSIHNADPVSRSNTL